MLSNYIKDEYGVVHQQECAPYTYSKEYVITRYVENDQLTQRMSYLRLGYIRGVVGDFKSILDVGIGNGAFLRAASEFAETTGGSDVFENPYLPSTSNRVTDITQDHWDVITFFDSLEHFQDLSFVKDLQCKYMVISVPWCHYPENDKWFGEWKHRRPDEHLHHFDNLSLSNFMASCGFELMTYSNVEDTIRKTNCVLPNILTAVFKNIK